MSKQPEAQVFDEKTLQREIERVWGSCGAHAEVYEMLLAQLTCLHALNAELVEALKWYVETDEVYEMPGNKFWLEGKARAQAVLAKAEAQQ